MACSQHNKCTDTINVMGSVLKYKNNKADYWRKKNTTCCTDKKNNCLKVVRNQYYKIKQTK